MRQEQKNNQIISKNKILRLVNEIEAESARDSRVGFDFDADTVIFLRHTRTVKRFLETISSDDLRDENLHGLVAALLEDVSRGSISKDTSCLLPVLRAIIQKKGSYQDSQYIPYEEREELVDFAKACKDLYKKGIFTKENFIALKNHPRSFSASKAIASFEESDGFFEKMHLSPSKKVFLTQRIFDSVIGASEYPDLIACTIQTLHKAEVLTAEIHDRIDHVNAKVLDSVLVALDRAGLLTASNVTELLSPANQYLLVPADFSWGIPSDLLTQEIFDGLLVRAKQENPGQKIQEYLGPILRYSNKRSAIVGANEERKKSQKHKWEIYGKLIGEPRYVLAEILKEAFSWSLGFKWLLKLLGRLDLPSIVLEIPTVSVSSPDIDNYVYRYLGVSHLKARAGHLVTSTIPYEITLLNFLFVPINYIARNIGKFLGVLILLPWTLPTTLINRAAHGIQTAIQSGRIRRKIKECFNDGDQSKLIHDWLNEKITVEPDTILKNATSSDVFTGVTEYAFTESIVRKNHFFEINRRMCDLEKAINKRAKKSKAQGIVATVLAAIFLTPLSLFVSLPLLIRSVREHNRLKEGFAEGKAEVTSLDDALQDSASKRKTPYEIGMRFLRGGDQEAAYIFLSRVPISSPDYDSAMRECGEIAFSNGFHEEARAFFERCKEKGMANVSSKLANGEEVVVQGVFEVPEERQKAPVVARSFAANSPGMFVLPSERGDDLLQNLNMPPEKVFKIN